MKTIDMTDEQLLQYCIDGKLYNDWASENGHENCAQNLAAMTLGARLKQYRQENKQINARLRAQEEVNENLRCCGNCAHKNPIAFIDKHGNIIVVGEGAFKNVSFVDADRAFLDDWKELGVVEKLSESLDYVLNRIALLQKDIAAFKAREA